MGIEDTQENRPVGRTSDGANSRNRGSRSVEGAHRQRYADERRRASHSAANPHPQHPAQHPQPHRSAAQAHHTGAKAAAAAKKQNNNRRIKKALIILAALILAIILILHLPLIPYTTMDHQGNENTTRISLMQKLRNWQPFLDIDGELESKTYSMEPKKEIEGVKDGVIDDGLDLDQIQEGQFGVLFLGTDESRSNTDVIMLALFDVRGNEIHILQIPRDTFVPGYTSFEAGKLNSVYTLGNPNKTPVQRVVDCLETIFKVPIDRYVTTSCGDIEEIVDIIGGVPIDMPYTITYEADKIINQGQQVLNGQQAEWMVRFRHDYTEGDIGRMKAQRIFMAAAMAKVCDINSIEMLGYINKIVDRKLIGSNLTVDEISKLSDFASTIGMDKITMHMLPGEGYNYYPPNPQSDIEYYSVWLMHKQPVTDLLNKYFRPYFEAEPELPIVEMLTPDEYRSTLYDDDMTDFQRLEDGDTFMGG